MSEEKDLKKSNCKLFIILLIMSLIMSTLTFILSLMTFNKLSESHNNRRNKVVISKKYDKNQSYEKALKQNKPMIVFFYTDWCGFCQRFAPTFYKITKNFDIKRNFAIAYVNGDERKNRQLINDFKVGGFPTVYVVKKDGEKIKLSNNTFFKEDSVKIITEDLMDILEDDKNGNEQKDND